MGATEILYGWTFGNEAPSDLLQECSELYSAHYGVWSQDSGARPGQPIKISPHKIREWTGFDSARIVTARANGHLVGYVIAIQSRIDGRVISWVTQLVVHRDFRKNDIGKTLLFSVWGFSDHFGWGLLTSNPYAVRALEKATRRRCDPARIQGDSALLFQFGDQLVDYFRRSPERQVDTAGSRTNTQFFIDHSSVPEKLAQCTSPETPWTLGDLPEGWEWLAFTFSDQPQIGLTREEVQKMLQASDQRTHQAYSRMNLGEGHLWARHGEAEVDRIVSYCAIGSESTVIDFGSGRGRHALPLAARGVRVTAVDYVKAFVDQGDAESVRTGLTNARFVHADCRSADLQIEADVVLCLYDVIGTYGDVADNVAIVENIARHLKTGGRALLSVMNFELTARKARHWFSLEKEPDRLLTLEASRTMESSGDVFDPEFYMVDRDTEVVYRKEQFLESSAAAPIEMIVRDRRFRPEQIASICEAAGLRVLWSRCVRSGKWDDALLPTDDRAKEILLLCEKAE